MKIRKLFKSPTLPWHMVLETMDGEYMEFFITPFRHITEKDMKPVPGYQAKGNNAEEAENYFYNLYGLEKAGEVRTL